MCVNTFSGLNWLFLTTLERVLGGYLYQNDSIINKRVDQWVNSGLVFFIVKYNQKYHNFFKVSMFLGLHSDFIFWNSSKWCFFFVNSDAIDLKQSAPPLLAPNM